MEFHRHLCEYSDYVQKSNIQTACPLQLIAEAPIIPNLRIFLKAKGVGFLTGITVFDINFFPDTEPRTICGIQALYNGNPVILPVAEDDIVIIKIGSPISGLISGGSGDPLSGIPVEAENFLNCDWSLWYRLAKASSKFGNPSAFCTHISESLLETFTALMPLTDYKMIYEQMTHTQIHDGHLISIAQSNWSLKIVFPQSQIVNSHQKQTHALIGYALTPKELGNFVKKPMCVCSGDEILAELLWQFNMPFDNILERITVNSYLLPLGLSPLLPRGHEDRPICVPSNTTNIALVGQFVEIVGESTLSLEYGVRSAELAVNHLLDLGIDLPKVKRSIAVTRYGSLSRSDLC
jgi:oleate hydratase